MSANYTWAAKHVLSNSEATLCFSLWAHMCTLLKLPSSAHCFLGSPYLPEASPVQTLLQLHGFCSFLSWLTLQLKISSIPLNNNDLAVGSRSLALTNTHTHTHKHGWEYPHQKVIACFCHHISSHMVNTYKCEVTVFFLFFFNPIKLVQR